MKLDGRLVDSDSAIGIEMKADPIISLKIGEGWW